MRRELETLSDEARQDLGRPIGFGIDMVPEKLGMTR